MEGDVITTSELFRFERRGLDKDGNVQGELITTGIVPGFEKRLRERASNCRSSCSGRTRRSPGRG